MPKQYIPREAFHYRSVPSRIGYSYVEDQSRSTDHSRTVRETESVTRSRKRGTKTDVASSAE